MNSEIEKVLINSVCAVTTLALISFFWEQTVLLIFLLGATGVYMLVNEGSWSAVPLYFVAFLLGPLAEFFGIHSGAWSYSSPYLLGFPLWLPLLWGNAALFFRRMTIFLDHVFQR